MTKTHTLSRRELLKLAGFSSLLPVISLSGCGGSSDSNINNSGTDTNIASGTTTTSTWASGDTRLITTDFPEDSIFTQGNTCQLSLFGDLTKGPCYFKDTTGEDISLGLTGLPMMLCLRLIDSSCQPLVNHTVEVWHCAIAGVYSGDTSISTDSSEFASSFCTNNNSAALNSTWYRGQLTTNANGRVNFKTNFPGWYSGRTIHIHFALSHPDGNYRLISQLGFADALATEVYTSHPLYRSRGNQDTNIANDGEFPSTNVDNFLLKTQRNPDNTLLAYHTIQVA